MSNVLAGLIRNTRTVLREPQILPQYLRWWACRLTRHAPSVWCTPQHRLAAWTDFSDFYWGRRLALMDAGDTRLMAQAFQGRPGARKVALDVGANVGLFSFNLLHAGFTEVHAFEPDPRTFSRLLRNIELNGVAGAITLNCLAVGQTWSLETFNVSGGAGLHHIDVPGVRTHPGQAVHVATLSLDEYCRRAGIDHVDFLKIDVEGFEPWVLRGMAELLTARRVGMLLIEIAPLALTRAGTSVQELHALLAQAGYPLRAISETGAIGDLLRVPELEAVEHLEFKFINAVCVPA